MTGSDARGMSTFICGVSCFPCGYQPVPVRNEERVHGKSKLIVLIPACKRQKITTMSELYFDVKIWNYGT